MLNPGVGKEAKSKQFGDELFFVQLIILDVGKNPSCRTWHAFHLRFWGLDICRH